MHTRLTCWSFVRRKIKKKTPEILNVVVFLMVGHAWSGQVRSGKGKGREDSKAKMTRLEFSIHLSTMVIVVSQRSLGQSPYRIVLYCKDTGVLSIYLFGRLVWSKAFRSFVQWDYTVVFSPLPPPSFLVFFFFRLNTVQFHIVLYCIGDGDVEEKRRMRIRRMRMRMERLYLSTYLPYLTYLTLPILLPSYSPLLAFPFLSLRSPFQFGFSPVGKKGRKRERERERERKSALI